MTMYKLTDLGTSSASASGDLSVVEPSDGEACNPELPRKLVRKQMAGGKEYGASTCQTELM